jgi:ribosomal silencing factor RsfS
VVHLMLPRVRDFYNLEKLWSVTEGNRESATVPL